MRWYQSPCDRSKPPRSTIHHCPRRTTLGIGQDTHQKLKQHASKVLKHIDILSPAQPPGKFTV